MECPQAVSAPRRQAPRPTLQQDHDVYTSVTTVDATSLPSRGVSRIGAVLMGAALDASLSTPTEQGAVSAQQLVDCTTAV